MIEPVKALTAVVKRFGGLCIIDGAHAPGVLDIDVADIGADFYLGNCHKWLYCPKGAAFMWVSPAQQTASFPEPTVISSSCVRDFIGRFAYTGTRDYTAFASIPTALRFIDSSLGGQEAVREYCFELCRQAASRPCTLWGTSLLV